MLDPQIQMVWTMFWPSSPPRLLVRCNLSLKIIWWDGRLGLENLLHNSSSAAVFEFSLENCMNLGVFVFANNNKQWQQQSSPTSGSCALYGKQFSVRFLFFSVFRCWYFCGLVFILFRRRWTRKFRVICYGNWWPRKSLLRWIYVTHFPRVVTSQSGYFPATEANGEGREKGLRLRKLEINNNKLRLICFMVFTLCPVPCCV